MAGARPFPTHIRGEFPNLTDLFRADSDDGAYWLGFLAATARVDGDRVILPASVPVIRHFGSLIVWLYKGEFAPIRKPEVEIPSDELILESRRLAEGLRKIGFDNDLHSPSRSRALEEERAENGTFPHFLRGFMEGAGRLVEREDTPALMIRGPGPLLRRMMIWSNRDLRARRGEREAFRIEGEGASTQLILEGQSRLTLLEVWLYGGIGYGSPYFDPAWKRTLSPPPQINPPRRKIRQPLRNARPPRKDPAAPELGLGI